MALGILQVRERRPEVWRQVGWSGEQEKAQSEWQTFWRFFRYLWPHRWIVALFILLGFVGTPLGQIGLLSCSSTRKAASCLEALPHSSGYCMPIYRQ